MTDAFLFIRHGWKSIWKQKAIWLFSAITIFNQLSDVVQVKRSTELLPSLIALATNLVYLYLFYVSYIGVLYLAYNYLIGKPVTIQDTLSAVKKFSGRVIGCSCLSFLAILPLMFWVLAVSLNSSTHSLEIQDKVIIVLMPLSVFAALFPFTIIGFFENDWGIRKSLDKAWYLFKSNLLIAGFKDI